ncbi:TIGR03086 family metal-binding protein [Nocardioides conyzicola]|uniref:Maleylpyruvate isomerase family mycothiol-dependent enzyme n=1 Tax=Nocardioides conyzicola TaxID=1651781 RepID=A0ABP8XH97_9ACTN
MTTTLPASVELLGRALDYTRARLAGVRGGLLDRPTPCAGWRLGDLLVHMEDSLDAFTEAAGGEVAVHLTHTTEGRIAAIEEKACALLGAWSRPGPGDVLVGGLDLASPLLVATAALEVTIHGWDVGRATEPAPIPAELAAALLPVAHLTITPADRGVRFAPALAVPSAAADEVRLLAFLGRG